LNNVNDIFNIFLHENLLNSDKTKIMKFTSTASTRCPLNFVLHFKSLQEVDMVKFLGLQLDNQVQGFCLTQHWFVFNEKAIYYILNINGLKLYTMRIVSHWLSME
jgi:hypothetical protein